jgi:hypothetical protein
MDGVVNELPDPIEAPPVDVANQLIVPTEAVAASTTAPVPHRLPGVLEATVGIALIVAATAVLEAVVQPLFVASTK